MTGVATLMEILDLARWAPSGDNTQPWRFEIQSGVHVVVHGFDTRDDCVYDLDGHSSQLALGGMLETIRIASSGHGLRARVVRRTDAPETQPDFDVHFVADETVRTSELIGCIQTRSVQRRPMRTRALWEKEKAALEASLGEGYSVRWLERFESRWRAARLMWLNAKLRLTIPEAYDVHRRIIEWNARFSADRIPDQALGVNPLTARLMRFAMASWSRVDFMNRWFGGTIAPRVELDLIPSVACGAHFLISSTLRCEGIDDYIAGGGAMQRFWLTASSLGLQVQPEMTPLIFARYAATGRQFSRVRGAQAAAQNIALRFAELFGIQAAECAVFMGRIGAGSPARARSLRLPLEALMGKGGALQER